MATSKATTVDAYVSSLPTERRAAIKAVRDLVNANLPAGFVEGIQFGMISWFVPLARYPDTHNGVPLGIISLAAQKNYNALYLVGVSGDPATSRWFTQAFTATGKKLDMGKACVRWKDLDALPLDVIAQAVRKVTLAKFLAAYEASKPTPTRAKPKSAKRE